MVKKWIDTIHRTGLHTSCGSIACYSRDQVAEEKSWIFKLYELGHESFWFCQEECITKTFFSSVCAAVFCVTSICKFLLQQNHADNVRVTKTSISCRRFLWDPRFKSNMQGCKRHAIQRYDRVKGFHKKVKRWTKHVREVIFSHLTAVLWGYIPHTDTVKFKNVRFFLFLFEVCFY